MAYSQLPRPFEPVGSLGSSSQREEPTEDLVRMGGLRISRCARGRSLSLSVTEDAPDSLRRAVEHCLTVRERVGGFAGLVVFRRDVEPGSYAIHTRLVGHAGDVIGAGWDLGRRLDLFTRVARSVQGLHEIGETVQALSPQHVLLNAGSSPHVLGPGLVVPEAERYRAPESRLHGMHDVRSDVFCLGALLHFLLVGEAPRQLEADDEPASFSTVELRGLRRIVRKACAPAPEQRYQSVYTLLADLRQHLDADRVGLDHARDAEREEHSGPLALDGGWRDDDSFVAAE